MYSVYRGIVKRLDAFVVK